MEREERIGKREKIKKAKKLNLVFSSFFFPPTNRRSKHGLRKQKNEVEIITNLEHQLIEI